MCHVHEVRSRANPQSGSIVLAVGIGERIFPRQPSSCTRFRQKQDVTLGISGSSRKNTESVTLLTEQNKPL